MDTIIQINTENGRFYEVNNKHKLISVTTLIDRFKDKTALFQWRKRVGEEKAQEVSNFSAGNGTRVHNLVEHFLKTRTMPVNDGSLAHQCFEKLLPLLRIIHPFGIEQKTFWVHPEREIGFAGTIDLFTQIEGSQITSRTSGNFPNELIWNISDIKTWWKQNKDGGFVAKTPRGQNSDGFFYPFITYCLQLAAYCAATNQRTSLEYGVNKAFIFGVTPTCRAPHIYYLNPHAIAWYWMNLKQMLICLNDNEKFNWKEFEQLSDQQGFLGERIDLKTQKEEEKNEQTGTFDTSSSSSN
jgi:hypothetical protein